MMRPTRPIHTILLLALAFGCAEKNALDIDHDGDGVTEFEGDCDDTDPDTYPGAAKSDSTTACMTDSDGDGWGAATVSGDVEAGTDCDDGDATIQTITNDADCDGVVSIGDCDDGDTALGAQAEDGDCDGVLSADDCDDGDSSMPNDDMDCDGVLTSDDCDDGDSSMPNDDMDCDGVLSADDCDDGDASMPNDDMDCDGVQRYHDCDDGDAGLGGVADDGDCDGVLTSDDCDDGDASKPNDDMDCDGVLTSDDCDDGDASKPNDDMDCDGVLTSDDCDDGDASTVYDMDCDGVLTSDDCDDGDASTVYDMDCDGVLTWDDCDDGDAESTILVSDGACGGPLDYVADHGGTMIKIDAQTFEMGSTAFIHDPISDENPAHDVTLTNDFYIGGTEVTQGEYESMMGTNPSSFSSCGLDCPVERVTWHESAAFANAVSDSEGLEQCYTCTGSGTSTSCSIAVEPYSCGGYRLPTEAEWEAAARCGEDKRYAGSDDEDEVAWYIYNSGGTTHTVATKASNACGLYDMSGNVWEWNQDWYSSSYYSSSPGTDPVGATSGDARVCRGGSWGSPPSDAGVANRGTCNPSIGYYSRGLRLLRTSP